MEKITPEDIEALIVDEDYLHHPGSTLTICVLTLANGFNVIGESACLNPEDYNEEIGHKIARDNAFSKIWALEGYRRKWFENGPTSVLTSTLISKIAHEADRVLCATKGWPIKPHWHDLPEHEAGNIVDSVETLLDNAGDLMAADPNEMGIFAVVVAAVSFTIGENDECAALIRHELSQEGV
ncbi:hypothetical protein DL1_08525 [Thioclava dalianensis]|uniref:Uncharacterized protein n=1 Tax=Thioclava dalianensis TaxID=1185766 RepID=A0A074TAK0_9RHOB|nr:hypothetical protein DL1_08525 [Thioclava dalianensis]